MGDKLYKGELADRTYLHAYALTFNYGEDAISTKVLPHQGSEFTELTSLETFDDYAEPHHLLWPKIKK